MALPVAATGFTTTAVLASRDDRVVGAYNGAKPPRLRSASTSAHTIYTMARANLANKKTELTRNRKISFSWKNAGEAID
jgi:hypothetical protein